MPLQIQGTSILADASIGSATGTFVLDTGNEAGFYTSTPYTQTNDLVRKLNAHFLGYNGRSYAGTSPEAYLARVGTMRFGDTPVASVIAHLATDSSDTNTLAGNIGQSIPGPVHECVRLHARPGSILNRRTAPGNRKSSTARASSSTYWNNGLQIMTVLPGSPGAEAGLRKGDIIAAIDGNAPSEDILQRAFLQAPSTVVHLTLRRGGQSHTVTVTLRDIL